MRRLHPAAVAGCLLLATLVLVAVAAPWLAPVDPFSISGAALNGPGGNHPFGTDDLGRDVYSGVVHGAANSLIVGTAAAVCATSIGLLVGGIAGLRPGVIDHLLMRTT